MSDSLIAVLYGP